MKKIILLSLLILLSFVLFNSAWAEDSTVLICPTTSELLARWNKTCYSCLVVVQLLDAFMNGAAMVYDVSAEAGSKILIVGLMLWIPFWALKNLMSMAGADPAQMLNEFIKMCFKVLVAAIIIKIGIASLVDYAVTPILNTGADYANAVLDESSPLDSSVSLTEEEKYKGNATVVSPDTLNKIMLFAKNASVKMSTFMAIGSALMCFSEENPWFDVIVTVPRLLAMFAGAVIWFIGFMMTLATCYYLLDIAFKLGFVVMMLPVAIGLWPFNLTKGRIASCIKIVINAAGLFVFLAITVSYGLVLVDNAFAVKYKDGSAPQKNTISAALGDLPGVSGSSSGQEALFEAIDKDDKDYVDERFEVTGEYFLIIAFCFVYAFKLLGKTPDFNSKFFSSGTGIDNENPMHKAATGITGRAAKLVTAPVKKAADIASNQAAKGLGKGAGKLAGAIAGKSKNQNTPADKKTPEDKKEAPTSKKLENLEQNKIKQEDKLQNLQKNGGKNQEIKKVQKNLKTINQNINKEKNNLAKQDKSTAIPDAKPGDLKDENQEKPQGGKDEKNSN